MHGQVVGFAVNGALYYVHNDHLGRAERITNASKSTVWRANNHDFDRVVAQDSIGGYKLGFPGQYYDSEKGSYYNYFRDYDPKIGRYIQSDPIGLAGGINTYAYVANNPIAFIDMYGLCSCPTNLAEVAKGYEKSTDWAYEKEKDDFGKGTNKCNQFVDDVIKEAGGELPQPNGWFGGNPLLAGQWADPNYKIDGWDVVADSPKPGDVMAIARDSGDATGHVGIVTGSNEATSTNYYSVVSNDWGFRQGQSPTVRRCSCN